MARQGRIKQNNGAAALQALQKEDLLDDPIPIL